ncbi:hypothetical protein ACHHRT_00010 [Desulfurivibrio sp. D14AmB]|uniref:hypothetical protein n=1 Tax=Desulfurivibrio sp. D14AmB TaxID=3374370 RepID=UPI00376F19B1
MLMDCRHAALPYFPKLRIACGYFRASRADAEEYRIRGPVRGKLNPTRHFIAKTEGNSMKGGKKTIRDGDYLLLEHTTPTSVGSNSSQIMAVERQEADGSICSFDRLKVILEPHELAVLEPGRR